MGYGIFCKFMKGLSDLEENIFIFCPSFWNKFIVLYLFAYIGFLKLIDKHSGWELKDNEVSSFYYSFLNGLSKD